jgi:late competence protein required for DNA uptake (superfamily II DNA/RNA helicase)
MKAAFNARHKSLVEANSIAVPVEIRFKNSNLVIPKRVWIRNLDWSTASSLSATIGRYLALKTAVQTCKFNAATTSA